MFVTHRFAERVEYAKDLELWLAHGEPFVSIFSHQNNHVELKILLPFYCPPSWFSLFLFVLRSFSVSLVSSFLWYQDIR